MSGFKDASFNKQIAESVLKHILSKVCICMAMMHDDCMLKKIQIENNEIIIRDYLFSNYLNRDEIMEKIEFNSAARTLEGDIYFNYQNWCRASGTNPLSKIRLTQKLKERGVRQQPSNGKRYYQGIKLVEFKESGGIFEPVQVVHI